MTHALIIGGGIAGPVSAMALHKAGIGATVYEAYPAPADDVGAFLVLFHNGLEALRTIDAHRPVLDASFPADRVEMLDAQGHGRERPVSGSGTADGRPVLGPRTLRRSALYRALREEAERRGVAVEFGKRLVAADVGPDGRVTARFADGSSARGDVLLGADGVRSLTRTLIDPEAPAPRHTGQITVCGFSPLVPAEAAPAPGVYRMIRGSRAFLGCTRAPDGAVWWFANTPGGELAPERLAAGTPEQRAGWRDHVAGLFADDASPAEAVVRATGDRIVAFNAYDLAHTPVWSRGPMVVLGDAAHTAAPNAAQGASLAIEDGVVLARCLRDLPLPGEAFAAFERLRRARVEALVDRSARLNARVVPGAGRHADRPGPGAAGGPEAESGDPADRFLHYRIDWGAPVSAAG